MSPTPVNSTPVRSLVSRLCTGAVPGLFVAVFGLASLVLLTGAAPARSLAAGVYAQDQAEQGRPVYEAQCAACHGSALEGGAGGAGALTGSFWSTWRGRSVGELYGLVKGSMPANAPSSLTDEQYAQVLAYMFAKGGYPAGAEPLPTDASLEAIEIGAVR